MLCDRLIAKTDVLHLTDSQVAETRPPSSPPFFHPSDEDQKKIHDDSIKQQRRNLETRLLRGDDRGYFYTKDSTYL